MLWIKADERDLVSRSAMKRMPERIIQSIQDFGCGHLLAECMEYWWVDKGLLIPFRTDVGRVLDLSFLQGVVDSNTMAVMSGVRRNDPARSGFDVLCFEGVRDLEFVKRTPVVINGKRWLAADLGIVGYTIFVHVREEVSIRRYVIGLDAGWKLTNDLLVSRKGIPWVRLLGSLSVLREFLRKRLFGLSDKSIDKISSAVYDRYRSLQRFRVDDDCQDGGIVVAISKSSSRRPGRR